MREFDGKIQDSGQDIQQKIDNLKTELARQQDIVDVAQKNIRRMIRELAEAEISVVVASDVVMDASRKMGPMDDIFFNKLGEDAEAIGEVISAVLGIKVKVRYTIPQYTITGIGNRGVRLDAFAAAVREVVVAAELEEDCYLGEKGAFINIEVQKSNNDDHEFRVYYNGASIIVNNTPRGTERFRDIPRAVVIYISDFDIFGEGEMYYEVSKFTVKSKSPRRSPVKEIYINTACEDRSDERMGKIADLMRVFKDPDLYDYDRFPKFSQKKWDLKHTEKGVMSMSKELQQVIDREVQKGIDRKVQQVIDSKKAEIRAEGEMDAAMLMNFLWSNGRGEEAKRASEDKNLFNKLLADFRRGVMAAE